jgi:hypothetical protein
VRAKTKHCVWHKCVPSVCAGCFFFLLKTRVLQVRGKCVYVCVCVCRCTCLYVCLCECTLCLRVRANVCEGLGKRTGAAATRIKHYAFHGAKRLLGRVDLEEVLIHHGHDMGSAHDRHSLLEELAPRFVHVQRNHSASRHRP